MSNNRVIADLAQTLSASSGGSIKVSNGSLISDTLTDSDYNGTPISGFTDSSEVATVITTGYISQQLGSVRDSSGIKAYLQGNIGTSINPLTSATYDVGDSANPIDEIILDSSASIFFGALSLTSILRSGTSAIAVAAAAAASPVSGSAETSFLLKTDSTQTDAQVDATTNAFTITESGDTKSTAFSPYHPKGYNISFNNSTNDELITATDNSFVIGTNDFTAEVWVYLTETLGSYNKVIWSGTGSSKFSLETQSTDNKLHVTDYQSTIFGTSSTALSVGVWTHVAVVRSSGTMKMYFDGTEVMSISNSTNFVGTEVRLARNDTTIILRDARLVVGTAVYTSAFTPPTEPLTAIANTKFLGANLPYLAYEDASGAGNAYGTIGGSPDIVSTTSPYDHVAYSPSSHGGSVYFDGTGDYLTVSSSGSTIGGLSSFTVEGWYWPDPSSENSTYDAIYSCAGGLSTGYQTAGRLYNYNGDVGFYWSSTDSVWVYNGDWVAGAWNHFAVTYDGTTTKVYINGAEVISTTSPSYSGTTDIQVSEPSYPAYGYISDFRISDSVIYTAAFTPPTEPLTAISGTQLLTCTNKNSIYDAAAGQDVTATGDAAASTTQYKWSSSTTFDDNGDYLTATIDPPGTGDYTIECWVRFNSMSAGNQSILSFGTYSPAIYYRSASNELAVYFSSAFYLSGFTPVADTWYHIAWTRSGTSCRLFVDGVQKGTTASNAHNVTSSSLRIGYDGVDYFGGYIEDVRYTKGLARYTADFTPPAATFEG